MFGVVRGVAVFGPPTLISAAVNGASSVYATDLDGDGDADVLSASQSDDKIAWYRNNGTGGFSAQIVISTSANSALSVYAADLDGDGDADVLSASAGDDKIAWYRNNGTGGFSVQNVIALFASGARSVYATDLDGDGDADVLSASFNDNKVAWYRSNGMGAFSSQIVISTSASGAYSVFATDLDDDGDADVLSASYLDNTIAWYRNNGTGGFSAQIVISTAADNAVSVYAIDLDGDGDTDVLSASGFDDKIAWYRNNGTGGFSAQIVISTAADNPRMVFAADLDNDGDVDVLSASYVDNKIAWYRNNGMGVFSSQIVITTTANGASSVYATDLDGDGDADVLSAAASGSGKIAWYENLPGFAIAKKTTASYSTTYSVGVLSTFHITTRDSVDQVGAVGAVTATIACVDALAGQPVYIGDGYDILFSLPRVGPCVVQVFIDSDFIGFVFGFNGVPLSCGPGKHVDQLLCVPCASNTFQNASDFVGSACPPCPPHTGTSSEQSLLNSATNCTCLAGYYSLDGPGTSCTSCPAHADCLGGPSLPMPKYGYARDDSSDQFALCPRPASCPAGGGCVQGYSGYLCKNCRAGYYADGNGECRLCPRGSRIWLSSYVLLIVGLSLAAALLVLFTLLKTGGDTKGDALASSVLRARKLPPSIPLVITAFQIVGVFSTANLSWPSSAQRALNAFNVFSLDVNLFASECSLASFGAKYAVALGTPAVFATLVVAQLLLVRIMKRYFPALSDLADVGLVSQLLATLFLAGPLAYLPLVRSTLVLFDCTRLPDERFYLDADMSVVCFEGKWWLLFPIGLLGALAYIVAIPVAIGSTLVIHREKLFTNVSVVRAYGSIYKLFRKQFTFMPVAILGKKLAIAMCSLFLSRLQAFQFAGLLLIILIGGGVQMHLQPYYFPVYDRIELVFTFLLSTVLVCGMMMHSSAGGNGGHDPTTLVVVVVGVAIVALVVSSVYFVVRDIRGIMKDRRARQNGATADNHASSHAKRLLALNKSNLRDIDDPAAFLSQLLRDNAPDTTERFDLPNRLTVGSVEMNEL